MRRIKKKSIPSQVNEQIIRMIERGELKIGDKLPSESELVRELGVGRGSIREAVGALAVIGVLTVRQGRGTYVNALPHKPLVHPLQWTNIKSYDRVKELVEARLALDLGIVKAAIEKANEKDLDNLRTGLRRLESARINRKRYVEAEKLFHTVLAQASHNDILLHFYNELKPLINVWIDMSTKIERNDFKAPYENHVEIVEAIERKDTEKASQAVSKHLTESWIFV